MVVLVGGRRRRRVARLVLVLRLVGVLLRAQVHRHPNRIGNLHRVRLRNVHRHPLNDAHVLDHRHVSDDGPRGDGNLDDVRNVDRVYFGHGEGHSLLDHMRW